MEPSNLPKENKAQQSGLPGSLKGQPPTTESTVPSSSQIQSGSSWDKGQTGTTEGSDPSSTQFQQSGSSWSKGTTSHQTEGTHGLESTQTKTDKGITVQSGQDVVDYLKQQHNLIESMFDKVLSTTSKDARQVAFTDLRRLLAVHEAAEEIVVHPRARAIVGDGVVDARLKEEAEGKKKLVKLESMDVNSKEFVAELQAFARDFKDHAHREEREEFAKFKPELDSKELQRMAKSVEIAESLAPTRPHPMAGEGRALNLMTGPFASMVDRTRDALKF
jgi:hemerythrin superfamily protein